MSNEEELLNDPQVTSSSHKTVFAEMLYSETLTSKQHLRSWEVTETGCGVRYTNGHLSRANTPVTWHFGQPCMFTSDRLSAYSSRWVLQPSRPAFKTRLMEVVCQCSARSSVSAARPDVLRKTRLVFLLRCHVSHVAPLVISLHLLWRHYSGFSCSMEYKIGRQRWERGKENSRRLYVGYFSIL